MGKIIDLTNQKFGRLTVLAQAKEKIGRYVAWDCICECGKMKTVRGDCLKNGATKSCGCLAKENGAKMIVKNRPKVQDLTNKKFGKLTVIQLDIDKNNHSIWLCQCDCGKITYAKTHQLTSLKKQSCGCLHYNDYIGKKFGRLLVIEKADKSNMGTYYWKCQCDCGNIIQVVGNNLQNGHTQSCGCLNSKGEEKISRILRENNIIFEKEKIFENFISDKKGYYRFDFYVNNQYLIEYDGIQHYMHNTGWNTQELVKMTQRRDNLKNKWCKENNIPLIRIPYTHFDNLQLEDLLLETSKFIFIGEGEE